MTFSVKGADDLRHTLEDMASKATEAGGEALVDEAEAVKEASQAVVPVKTGRLRDSAFVHVERHGDAVDAYIGYSAPYALYVHENPDQPQWKYLEAPFLERRTAIVRAVGSRVKASIRGGAE